MSVELGKWELDSVYNVDALELLAGMPDASVDAVITDPPYGVGKVSAWRSPSERFGEIVGNNGIYADWLGEAYRVIADCGALYMFANWQNAGEWKQAIASVGFAVRSVIVWDKLNHGLADLETCYAPQYELIVFAAKGHHVLRGKRPSDVIRHPRITPDQLIHPYEKPVGLLERLVLKSTDVGGVVVDCFAGSGATLQAATKNERHFIGSDISAEFVALANKRLALPFTLPMFAQGTP